MFAHCTILSLFLALVWALLHFAGKIGSLQFGLVQFIAADKHISLVFFGKSVGGQILIVIYISPSNISQCFNVSIFRIIFGWSFKLEKGHDPLCFQFFSLVALISVGSALFWKSTTPSNTETIFASHWNVENEFNVANATPIAFHLNAYNVGQFGRLQCFVVLQFFAIAAVQPIFLNCKRNRAAQPNLHMKIQYKNLIKLTLQLHINLHFNQVASRAAVAAVLDSFAFCSVFSRYVFGCLADCLLLCLHNCTVYTHQHTHQHTQPWLSVTMHSSFIQFMNLYIIIQFK